MLLSCLLLRQSPSYTLFPYTTLFRSNEKNVPSLLTFECVIEYLTLANQRIKYVYRVNINNDRRIEVERDGIELDRKSTRLNSSHVSISYAVFCLKKKNNYIISHNISS